MSFLRSVGAQAQSGTCAPVGAQAFLLPENGGDMEVVMSLLNR